MFKVFFLIFEADVAWEKIAQAGRGFVFILATYLLPFIALVTVAEGWGLMHWGRWQPKLGKIRIFNDLQTVVHFEILHALLLLAVVFISALLLHVASEKFHKRRTYLQSFTLIAYGFSPVLLLQFLNLYPTVNPAVSWGIGIVLAIWVLYQGIPRLLQVLPVHAFGNYLCTVLVVLLLSGLVQTFTAMYLLGYINFQHSAITRALGHWLGQ